MNLVFGESNETYVPAENKAPRYPQRLNRGVPKKQYEPDHEAKTKYQINNYVSAHRLTESYAFTVNQLSTVSCFYFRFLLHDSIIPSRAMFCFSGTRLLVSIEVPNLFEIQHSVIL